MRYTVVMGKHPVNRHLVWSSSVVVNQGQRSIPFLPGLILLGLGLVLLIAPRLVLGALAFALLILGAVLCYVAYKFVMLRKQISSLAKNMESSIYTSSFRRGGRADPDVIEIEDNKIVYH